MTTEAAAKLYEAQHHKQIKGKGYAAEAVDIICGGFPCVVCGNHQEAAIKAAPK